MIKRLTAAILLSCFICGAVSGQGFFWSKDPQPKEPDIGFAVYAPPLPARTVLKNYQRTFPGGKVNDRYEYISDLSREEILAFYYDQLLSQGFKETRDPRLHEYKHALHFMRGFLTTVTIVGFGDLVNDQFGKTPYFVIVDELPDVLGIGRYPVRQASRRKDMAVYPRSKQFLEMSQETGSNTSYFIDDDVQKVIGYYKDHMGQFNWRLEEQFPAKGRFNFHDILMRGTGESDLWAAHGITMDDLYPGVDVTIEGSTLVYKNQQGDKCFILINEFTDSPAYLRSVRIDPEPFQKHGKVWVSVMVQTPEQAAYQKNSFSNVARSISDVLGIDNYQSQGME